MLLPAWLLAQSPCPHQDIIVQLKPGEKPEVLLRAVAGKWPNAHFSLKKNLSERFHIYLFTTACGQFPDLDLLRNESEVIAATWDTPLDFRRDTVPNDSLFPSQWGLEKIRLPAVWPVSQGGHTPGGKEIVVAVMDNGFELFHPDLLANIWKNLNETLDGQDNDGNLKPDDVYGWNFTDNNPLFPITSTHGTNVLGVLGAQGNNLTGVAGVNWKVKMMLVHLEHLSEVTPALEYVLEMRERYNASGGAEGAFIVATNGSWGAPEPAFCSEFPLWGALYDTLGATGILSVAATVNEGNLDIDEVGDMPTSCPSEYLITVTASNPLDRKLDGLAFGKTTIDLAAPGEDIATTDPGGGFRTAFSGASAACPHVAGTIALLYSLPCTDLEELVEADPAAAARLVRDAILNGVEKISGMKDKTVTGGRLDAYGTMKYLHSYCIAEPKIRESGEFVETYVGGKGFLSLFPNPVTDELKITYSIKDFTNLKFNLFNALGQEVRATKQKQAEPFEAQTFTLDVSQLPAGIYFLNFFDLGQKISAKFVKL